MGNFLQIKFTCSIPHIPWIPQVYSTKLVQDPALVGLDSRLGIKRDKKLKRNAMHVRNRKHLLFI